MCLASIKYELNVLNGIDESGAFHVDMKVVQITLWYFNYYFTFKWIILFISYCIYLKFCYTLRRKSIQLSNVKCMYFHLKAKLFRIFYNVEFEFEFNYYLLIISTDIREAIHGKVKLRLDWKERRKKKTEEEVFSLTLVKAFVHPFFLSFFLSFFLFVVERERGVCRSSKNGVFSWSTKPHIFTRRKTAKHVNSS